MVRTLSDAAAVKAFAAARIAKISDDLDGYPALTLSAYCLDAIGVEDAALARRHWMVDHILMRWSDTLTRDIDHLPPCSIDSLVSVRQRMINARDALQGIRVILRGLGRFADVRLEAGDEPSADATEAEMTMPQSIDPGRQSAS